MIGIGMQFIAAHKLLHSSVISHIFAVEWDNTRWFVNQPGKGQVTE